jgi:preprotein translocase subunit YajC
MRFGFVTLLFLVCAASASAQTAPPAEPAAAPVAAPAPEGASAPAPTAAPAPAPEAAPASAPAASPVPAEAPAPTPAAAVAAAAPVAPGAALPPGTSAAAAGLPTPPGAAAAPGTPGAAVPTEEKKEEQPSFLQSCGPQILMLAVMFGIFYFLLIRPQQKKAREHQDLLRALKKGDRVVTNGGIFGTITGIDDKIAVIEVSEKVRIKVLRSQVAGKADSNLESLNNR